MSQKNDTDVANYKFNARHRIFVIFGRDAAETMLANDNLLFHLS